MKALLGPGRAEHFFRSGSNESFVEAHAKKGCDDVVLGVIAETAELPESFLAVPELDVLVLDTPAVQRVFQELAFETTVLGVLVKGGTSDRANAPAPSLGTAREVLLKGEAIGLQIHYVHGGAEWWTTLMRTAGGVRFVRVRKAAGEPSP